MSTLVIGGTGTVGSQVVKDLLERDSSVRVLIRSEAKTSQLPAGVRGVVGDLSQPATLSAAFEGIEQLALITAVSPGEAEQGVNAVRAARAAGVRRLVYLSVYQVERCPQAPHFASKIEIQRAIEASGIPHTLIMPGNFYQNDLRYQSSIVDNGIYPEPIGDLGIHRVDTRDVAEAIVIALTTPGHEGEHYPLVGPDALTGEIVATIYTQHLRRTVQYVGNDLEAWKRGAGAGMPEWLLTDLEIMFRFFQEEGHLAGDAEFAKQARVLGHPPRKFDVFVEETSKIWLPHVARH